MIFTSLCCLVLNPSDLASGMLSVLLLCLFVYYLSLHNNWHGVHYYTSIVRGCASSVTSTVPGKVDITKRKPLG